MKIYNTLLYMSKKTYRRVEVMAFKRFFGCVEDWFDSKGVGHTLIVFPNMRNIKIFYPSSLGEKIIETEDLFTKSSVNFKLLK